MKKVNYILLSLVLSTFLPLSYASAAGGTIETISGSVSSDTTLHATGKASDGTDVVAISIYDESETALLVGPETVETDTSYNFSYDLTGAFDTNTVYTVCAADYDGGTQTCEKTTVNIPINPDESSESEAEISSASTANTGTAPKGSETADVAILNISLGTSIIVASAILYGLYLIVKKKANR